MHHSVIGEHLVIAKERPKSQLRAPVMATMLIPLVPSPKKQIHHKDDTTPRSPPRAPVISSTLIQMDLPPMQTMIGMHDVPRSPLKKVAVT